MGFVARVDDRPALHRVHALQFGKEIAALGDLKARLEELVLFLPAILASPRKNLACDKERDYRLAERIPGESASASAPCIAGFRHGMPCWRRPTAITCSRSRRHARKRWGSWMSGAHCALSSKAWSSTPT